MKPRAAAVVGTIAVLVSACSSGVPEEEATAVAPDPRNAEEDADVQRFDLRLLTTRPSASDGDRLEYPLPYADDPVRAVENYETSEFYVFGDDGALLTDYGDRYAGAGVQFSPVASSQYCYASHSAWLASGDEAYAERVVGQAEALVGRAKPTDAGVVWTYDFPQQTFGAEPGWISGMAQGLAAACLTLAHSINGDERFLDHAEAALVAMAAPMDEGGTATTSGGTGVFYEEVAAPGLASSRILNGMVYALAGAETFLTEVGGDARVEQIVQDGLAGLRDALDDYFVPGMTLYDLGPRRASRLVADYNTVHAYQLLWLATQRPDVDVLERAFDAIRNETISLHRPSYEVLEGEVNEPRGVQNLAGTQSYFAGVRGKAVTIRLTSRRPFRAVSAYGYTGATTPLSMTAGDVVAERDGRVLVAELEQPLREVDVTLVPQDGMAPALFHLLPMPTTEDVPLDVLSSDLTGYRFAGPKTVSYVPPSRSPLNVLDGDPETSWSTSHRSSWLLVRVVDEAVGGIEIVSCADAPGPAAMTALDAELGILGTSATSTIATDGARFVLVEFDGPACVTAIQPV